jgi:hypothetical protein
VIRVRAVREYTAMNERTGNRLFPVLLLLLIAAGAFFGLAPFLLPTQFASFFGFAGADVLMYRIAGAATFGYAVGLAVGYRASWPELRVGIAATAVFNLGSLLACALAVAAGATPWVVFLIAIASLVFVPACLYYYSRPPTDRASGPADDDRPIAMWVTALFVIGTLSALVFGVAALFIAGSFGHSLGYPGMDDFIYRQGGAATLGAGVGGVLVLMDRRWSTARIATVMALTFNGLSVIAVLLDIAAGTAQPIAYVILAAAALVTVGTAAALMRGGR